MTDRELTSAFERLETVMKSVGLEWTLAQVQEEIRFGRRATKRVKATTDTPSAMIAFQNEGRARRKTVSFAATRPLGPGERLEVLIGAIEQVVVATYEMEQVVRDRVRRITDRSATIHLVHEEEDGEGITVAEPTPERQQHIARLKQLLAELRSLIR